MIYYLVSDDGTDAMKAYVRSWGPAPGSRIRMLRYSELLNLKSLEPGVYLFSDLERLSPPEIGLARQVWETLSAAKPRVRLLNDPSRVLCRYDLLKKFHRTGINRFRALRAAESLEALRYPVFVREENDHNGNLTPLLYGRADLDGHLRTLRLKGYPRRDLLVVEFCDTSDGEGIFRKYSAIRIGGEILPRHLLFSRNWNLKTPDLDGPAFEMEKNAYLRDNPHRPWLEGVFDAAGIDYGRIDYSLLDGEPQVWEINTNPTVKKLTPRLTSALEALEGPYQSGEGIALAIDPQTAPAISTEEGLRRRGRMIRRMMKKIAYSHWARPLVPLAKSILHASFKSPSY